MIQLRSFQNLRINPKTNPAILDTATWDPDSAWHVINQVGEGWVAAQAALSSGNTWAGTPEIPIEIYAVSHRGAAKFFLARMADGQEVFVELGEGGGSSILGSRLGVTRLQNGLNVAAYPADASVIDRFCRLLAPRKGPQALGSVPRLGIGCRMTTAVWPAVFEAMRRFSFAANPIQNSVRELNLLDDLFAGRPPNRNYACGFGTIESGYTGSTYEGLWVAGTLAALHEPGILTYGADADHLQVKRGPEGLARARQLLKASRYYTFFTMDLADILHYEALSADPPPDFWKNQVSTTGETNAIVRFHQRPLQVGGTTYRLSEDAIHRFAAKYWDALATIETLTQDISLLKEGRRFDLEFTIDEHPPEVAAFDCLTSEEELLFILREIERRGLPVTHLAPNYGAEKGWDYRGPDGIEGMERRVRALQAIAGEFEMMLDFHSADDLSSSTRAALRRATRGFLHYKISPMLQLLFVDILEKYAPELFLNWWNDAVAYACREAANGSEFAVECLQTYDHSSDKKPSRHHQVFHHYGFAYVGRRGEDETFAIREQFYTLPSEFYAAYRDYLVEYLGTLAEDLFEG
jgi:hypothetical protein